MGRTVEKVAEMKKGRERKGKEEGDSKSYVWKSQKEVVCFISLKYQKGKVWSAVIVTRALAPPVTQSGHTLAEGEDTYIWEQMFVNKNLNLSQDALSLQELNSFSEGKKHF